ncbi:MAG: hypothetical protein ABW360_04630 [Phenylobacterium sp.]
MLRLVLGTMAGVVLAMVAIVTLEAVGHQLFPVTGVDPSDPQALDSLVSHMSLAAQAFVIFGWTAGAALGGTVANLIARRRWPAIIVGGAIAASTVLNLLVLPHPLWMQAAGVLMPLLAGLAVARKVALPED